MCKTNSEVVRTQIGQEKTRRIFEKPFRQGDAPEHKAGAMPKPLLVTEEPKWLGDIQCAAGVPSGYRKAGQPLNLKYGSNRRPKPETKVANLSVTRQVCATSRS
jgi:hypothetical protein